MATINYSYITLTADGSPMQCYTATPSGNGPFPAIMVFQEAFGVNHHIRNLCDRFAEQGYVAIAPELYHCTAPAGFEAPYTDFSVIAPHAQATSEKTIENDIRACWDWLQQNALVNKDAIVCTGYCMGGRASFIGNCILPFKAAVSYYGGRIAPDVMKRANELHSPMLFFWGGQDKHITKETIDAIIGEMDKAEKKYTNVVISDADHGFFCDERSSYNPVAAKEAWALTLSFLETGLNA